MRLLSKGPEETSALGFRLGGLLRKGDVVCLYGELGAGKTTFVKGIASAFGIPERDITSASFTIVAEYEGRRNAAAIPFYHVDLYRIEGAPELDAIGIEGYLGKEGIAVVEWAERLGPVEDVIAVRFVAVNEKEREIVIEGLREEDRNHL